MAMKKAHESLPQHELVATSSTEVWQLIAEGRFKDAPSIAALALFQRHRAEHAD
ncbi:hypothetical protein OG689_38850 [Kitasatospora sp. NBC_00240]|uniref:hypothetical protein n=1 Tax=Kitasatospora sp. NBC_00240 TaxID=2903567 RepID=UPI00224FB8CA|nr:hypothetical protein [Kitasatospora sp. NBC_00240]MCX5215156.1 hypothetical protein [Kitasatospora sp. NBC_00240]